MTLMPLSAADGDIAALVWNELVGGAQPCSHYLPVVTNDFGVDYGSDTEIAGGELTQLTEIPEIQNWFF